MLVANLGAQALVVPPYTKLASVIEATTSTGCGTGIGIEWSPGIC